ncbi:putative ubiquitin hydrolase, putative,cysteine peptidase, Clan CA, family C19 [Trypanosoma theileri]|uniref:Ubiquitin carboxyl-terminal hydrolase n=1 Tax=Trypanosoma theileri TaxID=67003 RepID=A0A1X0NJ77_9TRYP|nr:putative ubiquitin hydrolase, putative,cysteine peptidase, Clan CA, family C19 [Trypanosoma theileri]ORC84736.1 putative ubiquitin hydrolase, putative,cysteine peptidase, Clan CA, family C19 [Trypanosoma theileri]
MASVKVKWGKEVLQLTVDLNITVKEFKEELQKTTNVPVERQKLMGLKPSALNDSARLLDVGVTNGKTVMLIGTAEALPAVSAPTSEEGKPRTTTTTTTTKQNVDNVSSVTITPNGLRNIGNTCYMNSAIQMLRLVPEIRSVLESNNHVPLLYQLGQMYKTLDEVRETFTPLLFWNSLIGRYPTFGERDDSGRPMQHDAQEALNGLVENITNVLPEEEKILFRGLLKQTMTCKNEGNSTPTVQDIPFLMLSCNINTEVQTLEAGLEAALNETVTLPSEGDSASTVYTRMSRISSLPEYLFVHLVRFSWRADTRVKAKILKPVTFPIVLDLFTFCSEELKETLKPEREEVMKRRDKELDRLREQKQKTRFESEGQTEETTSSLTSADAAASIGNKSGYYELCGVISHKGRSADSGHYVFWGRPTNQWMVFDDENVAPVTEEDIKRLRGVGEGHIAYVLMYRTRNPITKQTTLPL